MEIPAQLCHFYVGNMMFSTAGFWGIISIWVHYNDLTVLPHWNHVFLQGNDPQMAFFQVSEILKFTQKYPIYSGKAISVVLTVTFLEHKGSNVG